MASENVVRKIEIVGTSRGLDEVEDKLRSVSDATDELAKASEATAKVTENTSRRQISAAGAYDRLRSQIDQQYRAQRQLEKGQQTLDRAFQQGLTTQSEYERSMGLLRERYLAAAAANDNATKAAQRHTAALREMAQAEKLAASSADGQARFNSLLGVKELPSGAARASASVFEEAAKEADAFALKVQSLRDQLNPAEAAQNRVNAELAEYAEMAARGAISSDELARAQEMVRARVAAANGEVAKSPSLIDKLKSSVSQLVIAYAGIQGVRALTGMADAWSDMQSRVGAAVQDMEAAPRLMERMVQIANASYSPLSQTVEVYSRNVAVLRDLGRGATEAADFTEALNHALVLTATRGERAASVQNALSKAMAVGKLQADGLETILANGGEVAQALAQELGTSVSGLRAMATAGKITGDVIANAMITRLEDLRTRAAEMPATIGDAFTRLTTNFTAFVGQIDKGTGASEALAGLLSSLADGILAFGNGLMRVGSLVSSVLSPVFDAVSSIGDAIGGLDRWAKIAGAALLGAFGPVALGAVATLSLAIGTGLVNAVRAVTAAMLANPLGLLIAGVAAAIMAVYQFRDEIRNAIGVDVVQITTDAINTVIGTFVGGYDVIVETWRDIPAALGDIAYEAGYRFAEHIRYWINEAIIFVGDFIASLNKRIGTSISIPGLLGPIENNNPFAGKASDLRDRIGSLMSDAMGRDYVEKLKEIVSGSRDAAEATAELDAAVGRAGQTAKATGDEYQKLIDGAQRRVDQLQLEIDLVGKAGLEADALRFKYDLLAKAKEQNIKLGPQERAKIDELTESYRRLSAELATLEALDQLNFERSLIGLSDGDQKIMQSLRQWGLDVNTAQGQVVAGQMRVNQVMQESQNEIDKMGEIGKDAFMSILDLLYETGDIGDKLIGIFANIGKQFAKMGMERLWKAISGEGGSIFDGGMSSASPLAIARASGVASVSMTSGMKAMNDNLQQVSKSAMDVAKQFNGLNERADSKVLDSFMQASGTWRNLSAKDTAWCAAFANAAIVQAGGTGTGSNLASSFLDWGQGTNNPKPGDIVVLKPQARGASGHVGFVAGFGDGTVQVFGGNQKNSANVTSFGMDQVAAFRTDPSLFQTAVADGVTQGIKQVNGPGGAAAQAPGLAGQGMQNAMGIGGAAIGAFAGGFQSGDPLSGALSGGMAGYGAAPMISQAMGVSSMAGGLIGIAGGAILGLIGGLLGKAKQKKEELKKARQELEQQMGAITDLIARATGNFMGSYQSQLMQTSDEFTKAIALAEKAKNTKLVKELNEAQDEFFDNVADRWQRNFDGMIASMEAGMGLDSAYMAGMDAVEKMRETLVGFVNDAKMFSEAGDDLAGWLTDLKGIVKESGLLNRYMDGITDLPEFFSGGINVSQDMKDAVERWKAEIERLGVKVFNEGTAPTKDDAGTPITAVYETVDGLRDKLRDLGVEFNEQGEILRAAADANGAYADQVEQARQAAIKTALAAISGADEFTAMEEAVDKAQGAAKNMASLLDDLGVSAEEAARAIESHLNIAMAKMRDAYRDELNASINDKSGFGFINEIVDAHKLYEDRLRDATKLGLDGSLAMKELNLSLQGIVSSSSLTQGEIDMLAAAWPAMAGLIEAVAGKDAMAMVAEAESALRAAYEKQKSEIETTISRLERFTDTIKRFREEMRVNATSPLSQKEQMEEALKLYRETAAAAMSGDVDAQEKLTSVSQSALDEARAYYASSEEYAKIWREIDTTLELVERSAGRQLSEAQQQLEALNKQVGALIDINESVLSVEAAIAALANATSARDRQMQDQINAAKNSGVESKNAQIAEMYRSILGREGRADEIAWWANESGKSLLQIRADIEWQKNVLGSFQTGGYTGNMGVSDIAGFVHGQEFVMPAAQTKAYMPDLSAMYAGTYRAGNDNGAVVAAIGRLEAQNRDLQTELVRLKATVAAGAQQTISAVKEGNAELGEVADQLKRANSR